MMNAEESTQTLPLPATSPFREAMDTIKSDVLMCSICLESVTDDPICMTCKAQHTFYFQCMFDYYFNRRGNIDCISCPTCRHGNGSFIVMKRLRSVMNVLTSAGEGSSHGSRASNDGAEHEDDSPVVSDCYYEAVPLMQKRFPDSCVVTNKQVAIFANNAALIRTLLERTRGPRRRAGPARPCVGADLAQRRRVLPPAGASSHRDGLPPCAALSGDFGLPVAPKKRHGSVRSRALSLGRRSRGGSGRKRLVAGLDDRVRGEPVDARRRRR